MAKGHTNRRPTHASTANNFEQSAGPRVSINKTGPSGSKSGTKRNIINTLATRRMSQSIGQLRGGGAKQ